MEKVETGTSGRQSQTCPTREKRSTHNLANGSAEVCPGLGGFDDLNFPLGMEISRFQFFDVVYALVERYTMCLSRNGSGGRN